MVLFRYLLTIVVLCGLTGCGGSSDNSVASEVTKIETDVPSPMTGDPTPSQDTPSSAPRCASIVACKAQCFAYFPHKDPIAIQRKCSANGTLNSGACKKQLADNQFMIEQYSLCLLLPANEVMPSL